VEFGRNVRVSRHARFVTRPGDRIVIGNGCSIRAGAMLATYGGHIRLGSNCTVNAYSVLYGHGGLTIGDNTRIAAHVVIIPANHVFDDPDVPIYRQGETRVGITIGSDVWIASGARILDGVTIGTGAVIGAGAVVTRDVSELTVVVGNPARVVRQRGEAKPSNSG
jgi:acetyltransferase-like isoleucine patch superfamily enzyme